MRYLVAIAMLILALALVQPVAAQSFKPYYDAGDKAYTQNDYATALKHFRPLAKLGDAEAGSEAKQCANAVLKGGGAEARCLTAASSAPPLSTGRLQHRAASTPCASTAFLRGGSAQGRCRSTAVLEQGGAEAERCSSAVLKGGSL